MQNNKFRKLREEDYIRAYKDLEKFCFNNTKILLFGEFGNASFPSISDLDVFICLKDQNFLQDRDKIINFINSDDIRKYLFFHDPLILPESLLIYFKEFHTAYNLKLSYNPNNISFIESTIDQKKFLNKIWTTYLMGIGPGILTSPKLSSRDKLLVLKNICQSIENIDSNSDALYFSEETRNRFMNNKLTLLEVNEILNIKLNELYKKSENIQFGKNIGSKKDRFKVERNKIIVRDDHNSFSISQGEIIMYLNPENFNFFNQFYTKSSANNQIQNYIDNAVKIDKFCKSINTPYPFITPFGFQFYRTDIRFYLKKKILSI